MSADLSMEAVAPQVPAVAPRRRRLDPKYVPVLVTVALFGVMGTLGSVFYTGFFSAQVPGDTPANYFSR